MGTFTFAASRLRDAVDTVTSAGSHLEKLCNAFSYYKNYEANIRKFQEEVQILRARRAEVQMLIEEASNNGETIIPTAENWLARADATIEEATSFLQDNSGQNQSGIFRICADLRWRYWRSKSAEEKIPQVVRLREDGKFDTVSVLEPLMGTEFLSTGISLEFESRSRIEEDIHASLKRSDIRVIGLCGMGGVGKTTMAKKVAKKVKEENSFQVVVMAVISQMPELSRIQQDIADGLGLKFQEQPLHIRAERLRKRLMDMESVLIILDDVWKRLDLEELGIPSQNSGLKMILTSHDRDAITSTEDHTELVKMGVLTVEEAWDLFREKAGFTDDGLHVQYETAKQVAKQCKGLPLALVVVGTALRNKSEPSWRDALRQLERNLPPINTPQVLKDLYVPLKWSYDQLESEEARYIFLLCCLFPEDDNIPVETLVRYGWGLSIFSGIESIREARDRIEALVEMLKFRSLLMDAGYGKVNRVKVQVNRVKVHDVVRDMAISIASKDPYVFLLNDERNEWPTKDSYENYTHISVKLERDEVLPIESMNWPRLQFFGVKRVRRETLQLPENFFTSMGRLKVLELSWISLVPSSICLPTNLRALYLHNCYFENVSFLSKLINLEILSLGSLYVLKELPKELGLLTKLKLLDLTNCCNLVKIAPGAISGLVQLEELLMLQPCKFAAWEAEEVGKERSNASLSEVASLRNLVTLKIRIGNPKLLSFDPRNKLKLETFFVEMRGDHIYLSGEYKQKVIVCKCQEVTQIGNFFGSMVRNAENVQLDGDGCIGILNELAVEGFQKVRELYLIGCNNVEYLVDAFQMGPRSGVVSFAALKSLSLEMSNSLKGISCLDHPPPAGSFGSLARLNLYDLAGFKQAFSLSLVESLSCLEYLSISDCPKMEEVFKEGVEVDITTKNNSRFLKLCELHLVKLPGLEAFCKGIESIEFPALEWLQICDLPKMKSFCITKCNQNQEFLFNKEVSCPNLKRLNVTGLSCPIGIFDNGIPVGNFSGLETFQVRSCHGLRGIFSPPMFKGLTNLRQIVLTNCKELKEVIASEEGQEGQARSRETLFPQLQHLEFRNLPKIQRFCRLTHDIELPSLETMKIDDCPMLQTFSSGFLHSSAEVLLTKEIICTNLRCLQLCKVDSATGLFGYSVSRGLINLRMLRLKNCEELKEVISPEEGGEEQKQVNEAVFPRLKDLELIKLPKIHRFCQITRGLELPSLESVKIEDCPQMENFSLGSLHLPSLKKVRGIQDPNMATKLFFNKEKFSEEIHMDKTCFRLSPRDLSIGSITGGVTWNIIWMKSDSSERIFPVAELRRANGDSLEVSGGFVMANLSPGEAYEILYIIMLDVYACEWKDPVNFRVTLPEGITYHRTEILHDKPRGEWLEIIVAEFRVDPNQTGELEFSLCHKQHNFLFKRAGLLIQGVMI